MCIWAEEKERERRQMKKHFHTPQGVVERDLTPEELDEEKEKHLSNPCFKALLVVLENSFPVFYGKLKNMVKEKMVL